MQFVSHSLSQLDDLTPLAGKDIKVAGMVTMVEHRTTKTGKPFGTVTLEDYQGAYKFVFFAKDYSTYREYMLEGNTLYIHGKVQPRPYGETRELEFKINSITYLADIKQQKVKSLALKISIEDLTEGLIDQIGQIAEAHKGNTELEFLLWDPQSKIWVRMFSRSHKVEVADALLSRLEQIPQVSYKIF